MEQVVKNFKLICGALIIICCLLPFASVSILSVNGFSFFGAGILGLLGILLIVVGAAALIYLGVTKNDMTLFANFKLSFCAKIACLAGSVLCIIYILTAGQGLGIGFGLILCTIFSLCAFFEEKVIAAIEKK